MQAGTLFNEGRILVTGLGSALVVRTNLTLLNQGRQIDQFTIRDGGLVAVTNQAGNGTMTVRPEYLTVDGGRLAADELEVWAAPRGWRVMAFKSGRLEVRNLTSRGSTNHEPISVGDGLGIDDLWARTYFGHSPLTSEEREGDNDQDGLSARAEAVAGTDPSDPASGLRLRLERRMPVGLALRFGEVPGKWYRLWVSSDLQGWQELAAPRFTRPAPGVAEWVAEVDGLPPDGLSGGVPRRYYRVSVE